MTRAQVVACAASLVVIAATTRVIQGVYFDPATQLIAVQQRLAGQSDSMNRIVRPDGGDLSRDLGEWIVFWTPGTELFVYPLMRAGLSLGAAVRVLAAAALAVGAIGWAAWFGRFDLPPAWTLALAGVFPFVRHASNGLFFYSAEMLVFAAGPWLLLAAARFLRRGRGSIARDVLLAFAVGLALGAGYWLKASLGFVALGALVAIAVCEWRGARAVPRWIPVCAAAASGAAAPFLALVAINRVAGAAAATQATIAPVLRAASWRDAVDAISLPALQAADAGAVWQYLLMHPASRVVQDPIWISLIALPGALVIWWLVVSPRVTGAEAVLARSILVVSVMLVAALWTFAPISHEPRHIASAAFAALPLMLVEGRARWMSSPKGGTRALLAAAAIFYVCLPLAYGVASVAQKARRFPPDYHTGPARIYNALLSETNIAGVREWLVSRVSPDDVWYVPEPTSLLDLPGRAIISSADFDTVDELRGARFTTSQPIRVNALLPTRFERSGKGDVIRGSFPQARGWTHERVPESDYVLWTADLSVAH